jgi:hypothetical protein
MRRGEHVALADERAAAEVRVAVRRRVLVDQRHHEGPLARLGDMPTDDFRLEGAFGQLHAELGRPRRLPRLHLLAHQVARLGPGRRRASGTQDGHGTESRQREEILLTHDQVSPKRVMERRGIDSARLTRQNARTLRPACAQRALHWLIGDGNP